MNGLIMAGQLLLGLSILVILHELGHFLAARAFGIKVEKFYLFFDAWGVKLFSFKVGDTEYGVGWLPLGGYVKIAGMIDESMDKEQMAQPVQPWEFRAKPAWQRLIVMLGGIIVNIIVGIVIFWITTFTYGESYIPNNQLVNGVSPGIVGEQMGIRPGDRMVAINGQRIVRFEEIRSSKVLLGAPRLTISRNGNAIDLNVPETVLDSISKHGAEEFVFPRTMVDSVRHVTTPEELKKTGILSSIKSWLSNAGPQKIYTPAFDAGFKAGDKLLGVNGKKITFADEFVDEVQKNANKTIDVQVLRQGKELTLHPKVSPAGNIGISFSFAKLPEAHERYGFFESLSIGTVKAWDRFSENAQGVWKMITRKVSARNISSPIGISQVYGADFEWENFWRITGLISIALAFMNLLPIPALDGGHVVFLLIEMIKGRPLSDKVMERAQIVGFVILLSLMVFAFGNDLMKLLGK